MVETQNLFAVAVVLAITLPPALISWIYLRSKTPRVRLAASTLTMMLIGILFITPLTSILASTISTVSLGILAGYLLSHKLPWRASTILGFTIAGFTLGLFSATLWPGEAAFHVNPAGSALGDYIYEISIKTLGEEHSPQAHYTIPVPLRIPWVYLPSSTLLWTAIGLLVAATPMYTTPISLLKHKRKTN